MDPKDVKHQADLLRRSGKFDPARTVAPSPEEQLRELGQEERNVQTFSAAEKCPDCAQEQLANAGALCRKHLAAALGF